jgi:hypothetical protein
MMCVLGLDRCASLCPNYDMRHRHSRNLACGAGMNLDCDGVKTATSNFGIAIIALGRLYSVLSCRATFPEVLSTPRGRCADKWVSGILAGSCPIKAWSSRVVSH